MQHMKFDSLAMTQHTWMMSALKKHLTFFLSLKRSFTSYT